MQLQPKFQPGLVAWVSMGEKIEYMSQMHCQHSLHCHCFRDDGSTVAVLMLQSLMCLHAQSKGATWYSIEGLGFYVYYTSCSEPNSTATKQSPAYARLYALNKNVLLDMPYSLCSLEAPRFFVFSPHKHACCACTSTVEKPIVTCQTAFCQSAYCLHAFCLHAYCMHAYYKCA